MAEEDVSKGVAAEKGRDWVGEAVDTFIKGVEGPDPTDPVKAIKAYFERTAQEGLKARCKAEGKDAKGCWRFIQAVARRALSGSSGHIDPSAVYAIAMHWFEDVPMDWDKAGANAERSSATGAKKPAKDDAGIEKLEQVAQGQTEPVRQKAKGRPDKAKAQKKRKPNMQQDFFFEMLETPEEGGTEKGKVRE